MFSLAAKDRIQADGIHTEGRKKEEMANYKICKGGIKNQIHLLECTIKEGEEVTSYVGNEYHRHRCIHDVVRK